MRARPALVVFLLSCGGGQATQTAAPTPARAPEKKQSYEGLGAQSVAPELVAKYAPAPIDTKIAERIQAVLDIRGTGGGIVTSSGERILFTWRITGTTQVWRQDGPMRYPIQLTGGGENTVLVGLSPDDKFVVVSRDRGGDENPGIYLLDVEGGPLQEVYRKPGVQARFHFISDDARYLYFSANDVSPAAYALHRWDRTTGTTETLLTDPGLWGIVDHQGDTLLLVKEIGNVHTELWTLTDKKLAPLIGQNEDEEYYGRFGAKPGTFVVRTNSRGDFHRLYELAGGKLTAITPEVAHDIEGFAIDQPRTKIAYEVNEDGYSRAYVLDAKTYKPLALPSLPTAENVEIGNFSRTGRFMNVSTNGSTQPDATITYDWQTRKSVSWRVPATPEVDVRRFAKATLDRYPARDGTQIPMFVWRPASCSDPCPVVVEFHGGPESQSQAGFSPSAQFFVDAGFVFVRPNVRGSTGYGKAWLHADDGAKRLEVISDLEDCARFIKKEWAKGGVPPKVGVTGGSYGGYAVLMAMTYFAGAYDAGAEIVGISNLVTFLQNTSPYRRALRVSEYGDPDKDREALTKLSPVTYIDKVNAPLLLIQGLNDPRVPVGESIGMHDALARRGIDSPLIIFPDEGHGAGKRSNQVLSYGHIISFFQKNLK